MTGIFSHNWDPSYVINSISKFWGKHKGNFYVNISPGIPQGKEAEISGMWLKKIIEAYCQTQKAYFSDNAQIKLAYIANGTVFHLFQVKQPSSPVLSTILCFFWDFFNILYHITGVSI